MGASLVVLLSAAATAEEQRLATESQTQTLEIDLPAAVSSESLTPTTLPSPTPAALTPGPTSSGATRSSLRIEQTNYDSDKSKSLQESVKKDAQNAHSRMQQLQANLQELSINGPNSKTALVGAQLKEAEILFRQHNVRVQAEHVRCVRASLISYVILLSLQERYSKVSLCSSLQRKPMDDKARKRWDTFGCDSVLKQHNEL
eukprot:SAG31_NODE_121_length_23854_cov_16.182404_1_plen_202_part_00